MGTKATTLAATAASLMLLGSAPCRTLAATLAVTSTADSGPGSLREALASASAGDTIDARGVAGTITLTSGPLLVAGSLTVVGPGSASLTVSGNSTSRVFEITGDDVAIHGLTVAHGSSAENGAGIHISDAAGRLVLLRECVVTNNHTTLGGGGICNSGGATLNIRRCVISGNSAGGSGGGILNDNSTVSISASTISGNTASVSGGGILNDGQSVGGRVRISHSTLNGNVAYYGGGIYNAGPFSGSAALAAESCTFSGNSANAVGAILNDGAWGGVAQLQISACTISGNVALDGNVTIRNEGRFGGHADLDIGGTILDAGASGVTIENDAGEVRSLGWNLSSDGGGGVLTHTGDVSHTDPLLGPLQDNGGLTFTHALLSGSPAIDAGSGGTFGYLLNRDQRGVPLPFDDPATANATDGDGRDIGAFEVTPPLTILKQRIKLSFAKPDADSFSLTALLDLGPGFAPLGEVVFLEVGDASAILTLDAKGRGATDRGVIPAGKVTLAPSRETGQWTFRATWKRGSWQEPWAEWGLMNADVPKPGQTVTMLVFVQAGRMHFAGWHSMVYTARANQSGTAK